MLFVETMTDCARTTPILKADDDNGHGFHIKKHDDRKVNLSIH